MKDICYFLIVPMLNSLYHIRNIKGVEETATLLIYIVINFAISFVFYAVIKVIDRTNRLNSSQMGVWIMSLVCIDQVIKWVISYLKVDGGIWNNIVGIKPVMNKEQMAILNVLKINFPDATIIFIKVMIIIAISVTFFVLKKNRNVMSGFILLLAAGIATLLDSIIWGFTLDYVYFVGVTCYDLKDFYVNTALGFLLIEQIKWIKK